MQSNIAPDVDSNKNIFFKYDERIEKKPPRGGRSERAGMPGTLLTWHATVLPTVKLAKRLQDSE
jgi:hypothetical protein